jgi:hypothetical protein
MVSMISTHRVISASVAPLYLARVVNLCNAVCKNENATQDHPTPGTHRCHTFADYFGEAGLYFVVVMNPLRSFAIRDLS